MTLLKVGAETRWGIKLTGLPQVTSLFKGFCPHCAYSNLVLTEDEAVACLNCQWWTELKLILGPLPPEDPGCLNTRVRCPDLLKAGVFLFLIGIILGGAFRFVVLNLHRIEP